MHTAEYTTWYTEKTEQKYKVLFEMFVEKWKLIFCKHGILEHWGKKVLDTEYLELL